MRKKKTTKRTVSRLRTVRRRAKKATLTTSLAHGQVFIEPIVKIPFGTGITRSSADNLLPTPHVVFVHGVEVTGNRGTAGFSLPMQLSMGAHLYAARKEVVFTEALWSNVLEKVERRLLLIAKIGIAISTGGITAPGLAREIVQHIVEHELELDLKKAQGPVEQGLSFLLDQLLPNLKIPGAGVLEMIGSWLGDTILYHVPPLGIAVRECVRKYLTNNGAGTSRGPVVFAHSLGAVVIFDILKEDVAAGRPLSVRSLVTAGTPLGLLRPNEDTSFLTAVRWRNFYDKKDFLSFWNPLSRFGYDIEEPDSMDTGEYPVLAHIGYWGNGDIAANMLTRL